jgi:hypothetical protein
MFRSKNDSRSIFPRQDLSCVWIRANESPDAPLVCIWTDAKMRAFEGPETGTVEATVDSAPTDDGPKRTQALTAEGIKHSV